MTRRQREKRIVRALLRFGRTLQRSGDGAWVHKQTTAFLFGVLFDRNIPWERAWAAPKLLKKRLGTLSMRKIAAMPFSKVRRAIGLRPALHRFVNQLSKNVHEASKRVVNQYQGSTRRIWTTAKTNVEIKSNLLAFRGIGEKLANMTLRILWDSGIRKSDGKKHIGIAPDLHVRRVFVRVGFGKDNSPNMVIQKVQELYEKHPARLDGPMFVIGLKFCHPRNPDHKACPLGKVCPSRLKKPRKPLALKG